MIKFLKKHFGEISYGVTVIICIFFFVYILNVGSDFSSSIISQAQSRTEFYAAEQGRYIKNQYDSLFCETEFYAAKVSRAETEEEFKETVIGIKSTGELGGNEYAAELFYTKNGNVIKYDGTIVTGYPELSDLAETKTNKFSQMFQYENTVRAIACSAKTQNDTFADSVIVLFDSAAISLRSFATESDGTPAECISKSAFSLLVKHDGIIIDRVENDESFDIGTAKVQNGIIDKLFTDGRVRDEVIETLSGEGIKSFVFRVGTEQFVFTVNSFGDDFGNLCLADAFAINTVYPDGVDLTEVLWSALVGIAVVIVILVLSIVIARHASKKEIFRLEMIDPVLKCSTPKKFEKDSAEILKKHGGTNFAFVSLQINNFSYYAKKFGENEIRKLNEFTASVIRQALLIEETFCYAGDGEFLILMHYKERKSFTERISGMYARLSSFAGMNNDEKYKVVVSFAVYEAEQSERASVANMLEKLKIVKESATARLGVLNIDFYEDMLRENYIKKAEIESRMESALENSEFHLFYQPKYNLKTKNMDGSEILIRWYDPKIENYRVPNEFLPVFEEDGFINKIDRFVFYKACENIAERIERSQICYPISVNVSRVTATQPDFTDYYIRIKNKFGIKDKFITIEFTESFAYENYKFLSGIVSTLHENGFLCSIDDFGTGYSSYNILKMIEMDEIKLDRFFLGKGISEERDQTLLKNVIEMVKQLGMKVTQEGVESKEDLFRLEDLGCDVIQGYYFAKPMKYVDYLEFIDKNFIKK